MTTPAEKEAIKASKVLMVGAGGIGCELLKTLVMTGFKDIELIDMDTIEISNLNRQFLFRQRHVGKSKAKIAREAVLKFRPDAKVVAHHANVKDSQFDVDFFKRFNVVLNGLDNVEARRHVNRLCLAAEVPLVESGTTGYLGQVTVHIKGRTECYECQPKPVPKTFPTCTITNTPSKPVHCIVWAKELPFPKLFGDRSQASDLDIRTGDSNSEPDRREVLEEQKFWEKKLEESAISYARRIFDRLFGLNVAKTLEMEDLWKNRTKPHPLYIDEVLGDDDVSARSDDFSKEEDPRRISVARMLKLGEHEVWSLQDNARVFLRSLELILERRKGEIGSLTFDKDDQLAVEFVTAAANLRMASFHIPTQTLFNAKGIAGNIIHAIATTNAIIAGIVVIEATKIVSKHLDKCRMTYCLEHPSRSGKKSIVLRPSEPFEANPKCYVCQQASLVLEVNTETATLNEIIDKIITRKLSVVSPIISHGTTLLFETGDDLSREEQSAYAANAARTLCKFPTPIANGAALTIEDLQQEFRCTLQIVHRSDFDEEKEPDGMVLRGDVPEAKATANGEAAEPRHEAEGEVECLGDKEGQASSKRKREHNGVANGGKKSKAAPIEL